MDKQRILIVDDEEINRVILAEMLRDGLEEYDLVEAENGQAVLSQLEQDDNIALILLDLIMPIMGGFEVLEYMQERKLLDTIPVIVVTSEAVLDSEERAYSYGVADVIHKPFYSHIVKKRAENIIELYQSKHNMEVRLKEQEEAIRAQEKEIRENNEYMLEALCSVVESRSAETGEHTRRIKYFTKIMLKYLMEYFPEYGVTTIQAEEIVIASALHDIGKIGIPDAILLKPGRLTDEEFEKMKEHTTIGCDMLEKSYRDHSSDFYQYCYNICRHHHERWDGRGYPDHLSGNDIPICAQIVAVADVYDALVNPRVYKAAFSNEVAYNMIWNGECGKFSPDIMECFRLAKEDFFHMNTNLSHS